MSPALSPGVSSGWGQTVIITPGLAPDWGDADLTALYTSVMGVAPEAGKKYFCEFYWLDKKTGFTGESMVISAVSGRVRNARLSTTGTSTPPAIY